MSDGQSNGNPETLVSGARLRRCLDSTEFWVVQLPQYAARNQRRAAFWAIAAGILAAVTSLAIWPAVGESPTIGAKILVSVVSLAAAICALVPRIKGYGELAGAARVLSAQNGSILGRLVDLLAEQLSIRRRPRLWSTNSKL